MLHALAQDLYERGKLDLTDAFIDGSFAGAHSSHASRISVWARSSSR
ncbi:MAG: hypothetical protein ACREI8_10240 [Myxococcota bacterium]